MNIHYQIWNLITYPFPNFNCEAVEVCELISDRVCNYISILGLKIVHVSKGAHKTVQVSHLNTNTRQVAIHTSMALTYDTRGRRSLMDAAWVVIVSTVSSPSVTRAGTALMSIQKDTHDKTTTKQLGM